MGTGLEAFNKRILQLPYLKGVPTNQLPKLFAHYGQIMNTPRSGIGRGVHDILIPETPVQDIEHKPIVLFGQIRPLELQAMRGQDPQAKKLVI